MNEMGMAVNRRISKAEHEDDTFGHDEEAAAPGSPQYSAHDGLLGAA